MPAEADARQRSCGRVQAVKASKLFSRVRDTYSHRQMKRETIFLVEKSMLMHAATTNDSNSVVS